MTCPQCNSPKVRRYKKEGKDCIECSECYYDSCEEDSVTADQRNSQREKTRHSPYKSGR